MKRFGAMGYLAVLVLVGAAVQNATAQDLEIHDTAANEPWSGTAAMYFEVQLSSATWDTVTVNWSTADGTATAPDDYVAASGTLTFAPMEHLATFTVLVNADALTEGSETLQVTLSAPTNATLARATAVGTIRDPGAYLVKDVHPGYSSGDLSNLRDVAGRLFFAGNDTDDLSTQQLWTSDGTETGTTMLASFDGWLGEFVDVAGTLFFFTAPSCGGVTVRWQARPSSRTFLVV